VRATRGYTRNDYAPGPTRYDLILDIGGNAPLSRLRRALTENGTLVIVGGEDGGRFTGGMGRNLRALALSQLVRHRLTRSSRSTTVPTSSGSLSSSGPESSRPSSTESSHSTRRLTPCATSSRDAPEER
jgi:NADPH:quinone reductase-like Zn-dependent oxidoreductase